MIRTRGFRHQHKFSLHPTRSPPFFHTCMEMCIRFFGIFFYLGKIIFNIVLGNSFPSTY